MNLSPDLKLMVDAYIDEVGLNLPKKMRADIAVEIHSLILDALEGRSLEQGSDPDEAMLLAVLKEMGSPVQVATSYFPHNYVIGPRMYAPFWVTVRGSLIVLVIIFLLGFGVAYPQAFQSPLTFLGALWDLVGDFWNSALQAFGVIVLVFIVLERTLPDPDWTQQLKAWGALASVPFFRELFGRTTSSGAWDPAALVAVPKSERVRRSSLVFETAIIILVIILFNFFPHKVGIYGIVNGQPWFVPTLAPTFAGYLPWWNIYWTLSLVMSFVLLAAGRWTRLTRGLELGLMVFSGAVVYWMLVGPPVLGLTPAYLALNDTSAGAIRLAEETLIPILTTLFEIGLVVHLIFKAGSVLLKLIRLIRPVSAPAWKPTDG